VLVPVVGGVVVGIMARYGSKAIRGHGIPEAMEQVLLNESRIPMRITLLKPLSAAVSIGTGGPFGAEGPIIATGGALGSAIGQILKTTALERKTLLAAGAAAGMTATFGSPISAVLLAIELLLFEFRPRSFLPVALASAVAAGVRLMLVGGAPVFPMPVIPDASFPALVAYLFEGALIGLAAVITTKIVYAVEDGFERLPIHWMWWPALGGIAVGVVGLLSPHTMGVGYDNIEHIVDGSFAGKALLIFCAFKFISWSISLGSGTSGGTLAPLFTIGGGLGSVFGTGIAALLPAAGVDPRMAALVGMAAIFAGASRALLASIVFAFETTAQTHGLLPLLAGCSVSYIVSSMLMRHTIMTEKIARRGVRVPSEYIADVFEQLYVRDYAMKPLVTLRADDTLGAARAFIQSGSEASQHQGFPVVTESGGLVGILTRRDLLAPDVPREQPLKDLVSRPPLTVFEDSTLREAANLMVQERIGRVVVVSRQDPLKPVSILTRSDLLSAQRLQIKELKQRERSLKLVRR
jgi:H+/Cl- antiporter ClcA